MAEPVRTIIDIRNQTETSGKRIGVARGCFVLYPKNEVGSCLTMALIHVQQEALRPVVL